MPSATIYNLNANALSQMVGGSGTDFTTAVPTYAATMSIDLANNSSILINGLASTSATATLNANTGQLLQEASIMIKDTGGVTITFGTNFKSAGTVNPTTGKTITVFFQFNGTNWVETGRNASAVTH